MFASRGTDRPHRIPAEQQGQAILVPESLPKIPNKPAPLPIEQEIAAIPATTLKRKAEEAELDADAQAAGKKAKKDPSAGLSTDANGVILLDEDDEVMQTDPPANGSNGVEVIDLD